METTVDTRSIERDGEPVLQAKCPACETWGDIDTDQETGRVSLICPLCGWHGWVKK